MSTSAGGDLLWKLLLTAALCLHWFNPLVWAMYFCANRDLELACDEAVVRILGPDSRKDYAYALLTAEEGRFSPLCTTYAAKYHMEERIQAILKMKKQTLAALLAALVLVAGVTAVFATSRVPENLEDLPLAQPSEPVAAPVQPSGSENRVHPITGEPAGSIDAQPWEFEAVSPEEGEAGGTVVPDPAPEDRVHPITDTPAESNPAPADNTSAHPNYYNLPADHLHPDAATPNPANFWGLPEDGVLIKDTEYFAHNEEERREMIRTLRKMGYSGSFGISNYPSGKRSIIVQEGYDGVQRELKVPEGILPDWTYPVNAKGETYGSVMDWGVLGYNPDLISVVASNGQSGYVTDLDFTYHGYPGDVNDVDTVFSLDFQEWLKLQPKILKVPVYDVNRDYILGYFEYTNEDSYEYTMSQEEFERRLATLEDGLRNSGRSEEVIAQELEKFRQSCKLDMTLEEKRAAYGW